MNTHCKRKPSLLFLVARISKRIVNKRWISPCSTHFFKASKVLLTCSSAPSSHSEVPLGCSTIMPASLAILYSIVRRQLLKWILHSAKPPHMSSVMQFPSHPRFQHHSDPPLEIHPLEPGHYPRILSVRLLRDMLNRWHIGILASYRFTLL